MERRRLLSMLGAAPLMGQTVPRPAPNLEITFKNGTKTTLRQFRGQVLAFSCILTTCAHCRLHARVMAEVYKQYRTKGLAVLFAAMDPDPNIVGIVGRYQLTFPVGMADADKARKFMQHSDVKPTPVPWVALIDGRGTIQRQFIGSDPYCREGPDVVRAAVDAVLAVKPPAPKTKSAATLPGGDSRPPLHLQGRTYRPVG